MGKYLSIILAALSFFVIGNAHSVSHGRLHGVKKHGSRGIAESTATLFTGVAMFSNGTLSTQGLSTACENALYQTVDCDDTISSLVTNDYIGSFDNSTTTNSVCSSTCEASIVELYDLVSINCGISAEFVSGVSYLSLINQLWSGWNQSCFTDPESGENCNG